MRVGIAAASLAISEGKRQGDDVALQRRHLEAAEAWVVHGAARFAEARPALVDEDYEAYRQRDGTDLSGSFYVGSFALALADRAESNGELSLAKSDLQHALCGAAWTTAVEVVSDALLAQVAPWALGYSDPVSERVEGRPPA